MATTTSERVFVWLWLQAASHPVPAGVLQRRGGADALSFRYGDRYRERPDAIPLYGLPLDAPEWLPPTENLGMPAAIRDASPDSWGRRVILGRILPEAVDTADLDETAYLLQSGSNRLGAIDFQTSAIEYIPRNESATLDQLVNAAELVQRGMPLSDDLERALMYGTAIGGARPKALLADGGRELIAKFSTSTDTYDVVGAEAASMYLARRIGIPVADASIAYSMGRKVLLLERFDRGGQGERRMVVSGLTILGLPETFLPLGTYPDLLDKLRSASGRPVGLGAQFFRRAAFNVATSNTDDHLRNHAAFWDGRHLELTPAYDLSPVLRTGETGAQALGLNRGGDRRSELGILIDSAADYDLDRTEARAIVDEIVTTIASEWADAADFAELTQSDRSGMMSTLFLNPGSVRSASA